jgi:hypothetical protein
MLKSSKFFFLQVPTPLQQPCECSRKLQGSLQQACEGSRKIQTPLQQTCGVFWFSKTLQQLKTGQAGC